MTARTGVVYLQKNKMQIFSPFTGSIFELRFGPDMIRDLDVINPALIERQLKAFLASAKIAPCNVIFVLSDSTYFVKDFVLPTQQPKLAQNEITETVLKKQADEFIEHVPFDNVVSKMLPLKNGIKVCATNKDFYEAIAIALEHIGFTVTGVIPGLVLGNGISAKPVMDAVMANGILQKTNAVKQYDMLNQQVYQPQIKQDAEEVDEVELEQLQTKKPNKKRLYALVGVFASLLIVLLIVYVQSQTPPTPPKQPAEASSDSSTNPPPVTTAAPIVHEEPTTPVGSESGSLHASNLTVQILNASSSETAVEILREKLNAYKFKSLTIQSQSAVGSTSTIVSFSANTSQEVRNVVLSEVKKLKSNITVQDKQEGAYDITIVLGN